MSSAVRWPDVRARDIMRTDVVTVPDSATLTEAVQRLAEARISGMPVTDEAGHVIGVVSIRDVLDFLSENPDQRRVFAPRSYYLASTDEDLPPEEFDEIEVPEDTEATVAEVMTAEVFSVPVDAGLEAVAKALVEHQVHRVLVTDKRRHVGLVSVMDVLAALVSKD